MEVKKKKKMLIENFTKDNSGIRLKSIRLPRDLSLGGTKLRKKEYKPNINVIRNKHKSVNTSKEIQKHAQNPIVKNEGKKKFIQTTGIFSEGISGNDTLKVHRKLKSTPKQWSKTDNVLSLMEEHSNEDRQEPENVMKDLLGAYDSSSSDSEDKIFFKPVTWNITEEYLRNDPLVDDQLKCSSNKILDYLDSTARLSLWQLPSSFASKVDDSESKSSKSVDVQLSDLLEGEIGRIFVRRSGRVEVFVGDKKYHLDSTMLDSCSEDIVSLKIETEKSSIAVLGEVDCSFILSPDWSYLLC